MEDKKTIVFEDMQINDINQTVTLIEKAMNPDGAQWARQTFDYYFKSKIADINSGRDYYILRRKEEIIGLVGLHRYIWGPKENVWLSWFAVHPDRQNQGIGGLLIEKIIEIAKQKSYKKLFVETYSHDTFAKARSFYESKGFTQAGEIDSYLPDGSSMIVYSMSID